MIEEVLLGGFLGAFTGVLLIVGLALYIYFSFALMTIAKKQNVPSAWLAFIPLGNVWVMVRSANLNPWWTLAIFASLIPVVGQFLVLIAYAYAWYLIAERQKFNPFLGVLMVVPLVNLVIIGVFAWAKS